MNSLTIFMIFLNIVLLLTSYSDAACNPSVQHASACEHSTLSIQCEPGQKIRVKHANYGRLSPTVCNESGNMPVQNLTCSSGKSDVIVSAQCSGKQSCSVPANNEVFGDPCVGTYKYLNVDYECIPNISAVKKEVACENATPLNIVCEVGRVIKVLAANYGRLSPTICNESGNMPVQNLTCSSGNSDVIVRAQCCGKQSCSVPANNGVFGDPCVGTYKYLAVDYECIPK